MLQGERVVLRPVEADDSERLYELVETIEVRALSGSSPPLPLSLEEVEARDRRWIEERHTDSAWFAIDVDAETIGICGLQSIDHYQQRAEVGIRIGKPYRGRGHGQDADRTLVDYGFSKPTSPRSRSRSWPTTSARSAPIGRPGSSKRADCAITRGTTAPGMTSS